MTMKPLVAVLCLVAAACATADMPPAEAVSQLAPTGRLRAVLAPDDPVSRDVARQLARRLHVRLEATTFDAPFDVAFIVPEAARAAQLDFTEPYIILDGRPQVIALARGRPEAGDYLRDFVEELRASGFVAAAIERRGARGRASAP
jgi:peptidoglycan/xylan/chitin deacetylase (PgdA/CDA1 family)